MGPTFFGPEAWRPLARALTAFQEGRWDAVLEVHVAGGGSETMPVSLFFRGREGLRDVDRTALALARGRVLDAGAGVGSLALILQEEGLEVTAVEVIPRAVEIMVARGVRDARTGRLEDLEGETFDTILLLMNGTALAGTLSALPRLLSALERLLAVGGQILLDSTDLLEGEPGSRGEPYSWDPGDYPGELQYQVEFDGHRGTPFPQLFVDPLTLAAVAVEKGFRTEIVLRSEDGAFLARLVRWLPQDSGGDV